MAEAEPLVTVIIPAYDSAATIDATLRSVRAQTYRHLEILIVDDGSQDQTPQIVLDHATQDPRIRLIRQPNAGVARARNRAIAESTGELIAPIDADDLWRADKIERQVQALAASGPRTALVYAWYALIDGRDRILSLHHSPVARGDVLRQICRGNLIGNGSSPLIRKSVLVEIGGYEPALRDQGAQGCEDHLIYFRIAERHHFAVAADHLVGYRRTPTNMSSDVFQMVRSWRVVAQEMRARHPRYASEIRAGGADLIVWLMKGSRQAGRYGDMGRLALALARLAPVYALKRLIVVPALKRLRNQPAVAPGLQVFEIGAVA